MRREAGSLPGSLSSLSDLSSITVDCQDLCLQRSFSHGLDHSEHSSICLPPATASVPLGYLLKSVEYGCQETILIGICSSFTHILLVYMSIPAVDFLFSLTRGNVFPNHIYFSRPKCTISAIASFTAYHFCSNDLHDASITPLFVFISEKYF